MTLPTLAHLWKRARHSAMLYGALATFARLGAAVLLLPLILKRLSEGEIALWWVLIALGQLANLADFGFGTAISRVYSYLWAGADDFDTEGLRPPPTHHEPNYPRLRQFHATVRRVYWRIAFIGAALLAVGGSAFLYGRIGASPDPMKNWTIWGLFVLVAAFFLGTSYWTMACQGTNRVRELQASQLWSWLAYLLVTGLLLFLGFGLLALVFGTALRAIVIRLICRRAYVRCVPDAAGEQPQPDDSMVRRIWPNARKFGVLSIGVFLIYNGNVLICSHFLGDTVTASFGLTAQIGTIIVNLSGLWLAVKWPVITVLRTQGRLESMAVTFARRLLLVMVTFVILSAGLVAIGNPLLEWKGTHTRLLATPFLVVYLLYLGQQQLYVQFGSLTFTENVVPFFKISLYTGIGLIALSLIMTPMFGLWGLLLAPIIATLACSSWYPVWRGFQGQPLSVRSFLKASLLGRV